MTQFAQLGLAAPILKALAAEGYDTPTQIQTEAVPLVLAGRDLIGLAQTGTGKTAAFATPILHRLAGSPRRARARSARVLVLAPTRELAGQIGDGFLAYGKFMKVSVAVVYGGASLTKQRHAMAPGVDVLVATPGRLLDHVQEGGVSLADVECLVLDEADHMLDIGFIHALKRIAKLVPRDRQTLFFSATMPPAIEALAGDFLRDPARIAVTPTATTAERVAQWVVHVEHANKPAVLQSIVAETKVTRAIVFTRTKHGADRVKSRLAEAGFEAEVIHGNKSQNQRERALARFRSGDAPLLIATEVAARGIDVDDVSHVINYDLPNVPEQYVHRIGRTARAGREGVAISFCAPDERVFLRDIERLTQQPVDVRTHALSLPTPQPGDRLPPALKTGGGGRPQARPFTARGDHRQGERHGDRGGKRQERRPAAGEGGGKSAPSGAPRSDASRSDAPRSAASPRHSPPGTSHAAKPTSAKPASAKSASAKSLAGKANRPGKPGAKPARGDGANALWSNHGAPRQNGRRDRRGGGH